MAEGVRIYPLHLADVRLPESELARVYFVHDPAICERSA